MRIVVLSDIHGNLPALEAVFEDFKKRRPDGLIAAGDFIGGPSVNQSIELLKSLKPQWLILGNSDINLLRFIDGQAPVIYQTARQFALLRWNSTHTSVESIEFLRGLPQQQVIALDDGFSIRVVHGSIDNPYDGYDPEEEGEKFAADLQRLIESVLICGHTHRPWVVERSGKLAFNPGSVAGPLNGCIDAQYALLETSDGKLNLQLLTVPYDLSRIRKGFIESGLLEAGGALARCFLYSIESGRDVSRQFFEHASRLAERTGCPNCQVFPDEIWDQADASFDWVSFSGIDA